MVLQDECSLVLNVRHFVIVFAEEVVGFDD